MVVGYEIYPLTGEGGKKGGWVNVFVLLGGLTGSNLMLRDEGEDC